MIYRLIFKNQLTKRVYTFLREDISVTPHFYRFALPVGLEEGEYEYFITEVGFGELVLNENDIRKSTVGGWEITICDRGMAQVIGIKEKEKTETYNLENAYIQYDG